MTERQHRLLEEYGLAAVQPTDGAKVDGVSMTCFGIASYGWSGHLLLEGVIFFFFLFILLRLDIPLRRLAG